ncbi:MAG: NAD(P)H-dependent glycerol-3-phosphate dehydrogenase [Chloroflexota bacterium]|nr:NAD(P)-dependent glycerol-3-phosphate dehydrogenase [Dehalococcoidia bacterium]MDW8254343.1 NAD(P)H-dependent glycerol-3-phosphate dehydrogenase [Chloroflexota bacterium]
MIAVVGATTWGTTLALLWSRLGRPVRLLVRTEEEAETLRRDGCNRRRVPDYRFPPSLRVTADPIEAFHRAEAIVLAVPSQTMRENVRRIADAVPADAIIVSAAKGIEIATRARMSEVIGSELPHHAGRVVALSGPNLSKEIAAGLPAATVVAAEDAAVATRAQDLLMTPMFRVYTNRDIIGVELGGALKNVYALVAGISDGLGMGDNAKAGVITRGLAEMSRLGEAAGAQRQTFAGLSGLGDLVATCVSPTSRNHQVGFRLAQGKPLEAVLRDLGQVAEGVPTTRAATRLGAELGVELPIAEAIHRVLFEGVPARAAAMALLERERKAEFPD